MPTLQCPEPCKEPPNEGRRGRYGRAPRWYFDLRERTCKPFVYSGIGGNSNNFLTKSECRLKCPEFENPCSSGEPYREPKAGMIRFCNQLSANDCPTNYWCHVGFNRDTTVCCPGGEHPCELPLSVGTGDAVLNRWYFNGATKQCVHFVYRGFGGNRNNFLSKKLCQQHCPELVNPCAEGSPLAEVSGRIIHCTADNPYICPIDHFCHVGQEESVCCPSGGNVCEQSLQAGVGPYSLRRWFFNQRKGTCESFVYNGALGNANNFATEELCHGRCVGVHNPCIGQPYRTLYGELVHCTDDNECPRQHYCHIGIWTSSSVCCPTTLAKWENPCSQGASPYADSFGRMLWCDNDGEVQCPKNYYCHIGAEPSNRACCPVKGDPCHQPISVGIGMANIKRWYFDANSGQCLSFVYSGMAGNANNFMTHAECTLRCAVEMKRNRYPIKRCPHGEPFGSDKWKLNGCNVGCPLYYKCTSVDGVAEYCCPDPGVFCLLPIHRGISRCERAPKMRFAFHASAGQCVPFEFSGCGGNLNNFYTIEFCQHQCELLSKG
uniref:BPTI/Kunitz inhibitor domain-containing protein n=1 Tax=Trichuris muris TaxID=70415 RepID=A0A5S6R2B3_TRIMR